jgi:hypothetical protein
MSSQTTDMWEKEFDEYFENLRWDSRKGTMNIKDFISQSIQAARIEAIEEERKKLKDEVDALIEGNLERLNRPGTRMTTGQTWYQNALKDVLAIINKHQ